MLKRSDLVLAIGYDPIEYEARNWNAEKDAKIIVIDDTPAEIDGFMQPEKELIGDIAGNLMSLTTSLTGTQTTDEAKLYLDDLRTRLNDRDIVKNTNVAGIVHPLEVINVLQEKTDDSMTVTVDVGSHYIWMARHFKSYEPRHILFSNGMQTLGVALPWAISAALVRPNTQIISISGDGGFLFSSQDLETAVRKNLKIIHLIWNDGHYNMVEFQEEMKYNRSSGVELGPVDFVKYAESFGALGLRATSKKELEEAIQVGMATEGPVIIDIPIDYSDNKDLGKSILPDQFY